MYAFSRHGWMKKKYIVVVYRIIILLNNRVFIWYEKRLLLYLHYRSFSSSYAVVSCIPKQREKGSEAITDFIVQNSSHNDYKITDCRK